MEPISSTRTDSPYRILMTTLPDEEQARDLARSIVGMKLAACVNILPRMTSIYQWLGELEEGNEHLLLIKTRQSCIEELQARIREEHPYELPEIVVVPIVDGYPPYLNWINESVT